MADFPSQVAFPVGNITINALSANRLDWPGILGGTSWASATYPTASMAFFIPFVLGAPLIVAQMLVYNGTAVSGNVDAGIYDTEGNLIVAKGSTAQSGTSAVQALDITDTLLNPGNYYMAVVADNTTATMMTYTHGTSQPAQSMGYLQAASTFPLATCTFAAKSGAKCPIVGLTGSATV